MNYTNEITRLEELIETKDQLLTTYQENIEELQLYVENIIGDSFMFEHQSLVKVLKNVLTELRKFKEISK